MYVNRQGKMYFGIKAQNIDSDLSEKNDIPMGIYISRVESDSPAYQAGLQRATLFSVSTKCHVTRCRGLMTSFMTAPTDR